MEAALRYGNKKIIISNERLYQFVISISMGEIKFDQFVERLKTNTSAI